MTKFFLWPMGGCPGTLDGMRIASMSRRSTRTQNEWKVEMTGLAMLNPPTSFSTRSPISAAALLVNVIARMDSGITPLCSIRYAMRYVMTRVFPLPAPARINTGPSVVSTASRCCGFSWSRKDNSETGSGVDLSILQDPYGRADTRETTHLKRLERASSETDTSVEEGYSSNQDLIKETGCRNSWRNIPISLINLNRTSNGSRSLGSFFR